MVGIYFSGTGNTRHCIKHFLSIADPSSSCFPIEHEEAANRLEKDDFIVFAYPIYFSNLPKIVYDFMVAHRDSFVRKHIFIISTMGLFSGDGAGCGARLLEQFGADVVGGLHLKMPDCIGDEKVLKRKLEENQALVRAAEIRIEEAARKFKNGAPTQDGLGLICHLAGFLGQRLWFYNKTKKYSNKLKINVQKCVGCGICVKLCPLENLKIINKKAQNGGKCTMCYRCVNNCPQEAITLLGKTLHEQCRIERYHSERD